MTKDTDITILLERLLNQSRQDKLMYLNSADKQHLPAYKRFFNQQALFRNSMFNELSALLSDYGIEAENVLLKRPDIRSLMMTSIKRDKINPFNKCLAQDLLFRESLKALISLDKGEKNQSIYHKQLVKIERCIEDNKAFSKVIAGKEIAANDFIGSNR